jgi:hypothetical protein
MYSSGVIDFGLWTLESPNGSCVSLKDAQQDYSWAVSGSWLLNSDISWTTSRVFAIASVSFGTASLVNVRHAIL